MSMDADPGYLLVNLSVDATEYYLSTQYVHLVHQWVAGIESFGSVQYSLDTQHGGYCRLGLGTVSFFPDIFEEDWPPPMELSVTCSYTATTEAAAEVFFTGSIYLTSFNFESVVYSFYPTNDDVDLLEEGATYTESSYPYPRAFGAVVHAPALRLADAGGGNQRYCLASIQGTVGTHWHAYDDGVNIDANVGTVAGNVFELTVAPVGEVTISGTGEDTTLAEIVSWACGASYLNLTYDGTYSRGTSPSLSYYATTQQRLTDFLSGICSTYTHLFYRLAGTLYLVDMLLDNGTQTSNEFEFFPLTYSYNYPIKTLSASWVTREAAEGLTSDSGITAKYIKEVDHETTVTTDYSYGQELSFTPYQTSKSAIDTALGNILTVLQKPIVNWRIPIQEGLPVPGEKTSWTDQSLVVDTDAWFRARTIKFDIDNWEIVIEGEGEVSEA